MTCKDEPHNYDYFNLGKRFVNVYTGKEWSKAIHNGLTLPVALTWYSYASQNSANDVIANEPSERRRSDGEVSRRGYSEDGEAAAE